MNEVLKKLLESSILSEESRTELTEAFKTTLEEAVSTAVSEAKEQATAETKVELHEKFAQQREAIIDALESKVNEFLTNEVMLLKADIKRFRNLEEEAAVALAKEKTRLSEQLKTDMNTLVTKLDSFLETRVNEEFQIMKDDLLESKKLDFGRKIFESFLPEYRKSFVNPSKSEAELMEAKEKLDKLNKKYKNMKKDKEELYRKVKLESVLSPLSGSHRELMESILNSVPTDRLEESYRVYIKRVLKESEEVTKPVKEKPTKTITESAQVTEPVVETVVITGDTEEVVDLNESVHVGTTDEARYAIMKLAGIEY